MNVLTDIFTVSPILPYSLHTLIYTHLSGVPSHQCGCGRIRLGTLKVKVWTGTSWALILPDNSANIPVRQAVFKRNGFFIIKLLRTCTAPFLKWRFVVTVYKI